MPGCRCTPIRKGVIHVWIFNEAQGRYDEWNTTQVKLKLNNKTDADILAWIRKQKYSRDTSVQGAIKSLIRADIAGSQAEGAQG